MVISTKQIFDLVSNNPFEWKLQQYNNYYICSHRGPNTLKSELEFELNGLIFTKEKIISRPLPYFKDISTANLKDDFMEL